MTPTSTAIHSALFVVIAALLSYSAVCHAEEARIVRDQYGVPHIFAESADAAAYALGIAQCEDNLATVVYCLHAGMGRLSELLGPNYLEVDKESRTLGHAYFSERDWETLDPRLRSLVAAYCAGVTEYLRAHPEELPYKVHAIEPIQVIAWHRYVMTLSAVGICRADAEASKANGYLPVESGETDSPHDPIQPGKSNSWALDGSKTAAGVPLLLIDPHWASSGHLQLYEAYVHGGELQVGGFMLNGTPLVGLGVSPVAAWTVTAGGADSSDAYALRLNPENPNQYEFDGEWESMAVRSELIKVRQDDGSLRAETLEVRSTRHGIVLQTKTGVPYAAAFAGHDRGNVMEQTYRMAVARSTNEFKQALALDRYSYFNLMWATADANVGYVQTGCVPRRRAGWNYEQMLPGWRSDALWDGQIAFNDLPSVENPATGFLQNCNVAANVVTPGLNFTKDDFPIGALYGHYGAYRARGQRATQLLSDLQDATMDDAESISFDTYVPPADLWVPLILEACAEPSSTNLSSDDERLVQRAAEILRSWNRYATRDSVGATTFRFWRLECDQLPAPVGRDDFQIASTADVRRDARTALLRSAQRLMSQYGRLDIPWGDVKRLQRGDKDWPLSGDGLGKLGMDTLRATAGDTFDEHGHLIASGGQCVTSIVLLTNPPEIRSVVTYGQSNKPASPHYSDQATLYSSETMRPVPWTLDAVLREAESDTRVEYNPTAKRIR